MARKAKNPDIQTALNQFRASEAAYKLYRQYYAGDHRLAFATEKYKNAFADLFTEFADNVCPSVVDTMVDRLAVDGFGFPKGKEPASEARGDEILAAIDAIWADNGMDRRAGEIHKEAAKCGDAYVIVWPDKETGEPTIYPNKADRMTVFYSDEKPGDLLWAAKRWITSDKKTRLNMYYPDRTERYITVDSVFGAPVQTSDVAAAGSVDQSAGVQVAASNNANSFVQFDGGDTPWSTPNKYGRVPVFHLANNGDVGDFGISELKVAIPLQDALNKAIADMLVAMEFVALPQRWATGIEPRYDDQGNEIAPFIPGVDRLWTLQKTDGEFGQFPGTDLKQFLEIQEKFRGEIARVTNTPGHYMMLTGGNFPSGESLKTAETPFTAKLDDRVLTYGEFWSAVFEFCLLISGNTEGVRLETKWVDTAPKSDKELAETLATHQTLKNAVYLRKAGYTEDEISEILANGADLADALMSAFTNGATAIPNNRVAAPAAGPEAEPEAEPAEVEMGAAAGTDTPARSTNGRVPVGARA